MYTYYDRERDEQTMRAYAPTPGNVARGGIYAGLALGAGLTARHLVKNEYNAPGSKLQEWAKNKFTGVAFDGPDGFKNMVKAFNKNKWEHVFNDKFTGGIHSWASFGATGSFKGAGVKNVWNEFAEASKGGLWTKLKRESFLKSPFKMSSATNSIQFESEKLAQEAYATWSEKLGSAQKVSNARARAAFDMYEPATPKININGNKVSMTKSGARGVARPRIAGIGVAAGIAAMTINSEMKQDGMSGMATGVAKVAAMSVGSKVGGIIGAAVLGTPGAFIGQAVGAIGGDMAVDLVKGYAKLGHRLTTPDTGGYFKDSEMGMTMRQRSLNAIRTSQFNIRSDFGNEARMLSAGY